jgi:hypothetical protein
MLNWFFNPHFLHKHSANNISVIINPYKWKSGLKQNNVKNFYDVFSVKEAIMYRHFNLKISHTKYAANIL